jgi:hypothetical protein
MKNAKSRGTSANATRKKPSRFTHRSMGDQMRTIPHATAQAQAPRDAPRFPEIATGASPIVAGTLKARLPGAAWQSYAPGQSFVVPAKASFDVEAAADVAYLCHYKK